ncbi:MAG: carbonic anhydrase [Blastocatellia bacterium]|nr:carbonic anhydrase [Blastocatellia bacterium]
MKKALPWLSLFISLNVFAITHQEHHKPHKKTKFVTAEKALRKLIEGNRRFVTHHMKHPDETVARRINLARKGQHPFAIVLSCSDSRLPPEIIFDEGLGDLFVVRVAGNIADDAVIASIEYAAEHLGTTLLIVLGHENCGAVHAAIANQHEGHLGTLVDAILPAVEKVRHRTPTNQQAADSVHFNELVARANVEAVIAKLRASEPVLSRLVSEKRLVVVGGYYHLGSGKVSLLHP